MDVPMWLHNTIRKQQKISNLKCFACCYSACMHSFNCAQDFIRGWKSWHDDEIHRWCLCKTVLWGGFRAVFSQQYGSNEACATSQNRRKKKKKRRKKKKKKLAWMCRYMRRIQIKKSDLNRRGSGLVARDLTFIFFFSTKLADEVGHWSQHVTPSWLSRVCSVAPKTVSPSEGECANEI